MAKQELYDFALHQFKLTRGDFSLRLQFAKGADGDDRIHDLSESSEMDPEDFTFGDFCEHASGLNPEFTLWWKYKTQHERVSYLANYPYCCGILSLHHRPTVDKETRLDFEEVVRGLATELGYTLLSCVHYDHHEWFTDAPSVNVEFKNKRTGSKLVIKNIALGD